MYRTFVSLGCMCATAQSMEKYGLRSFSGPFDWCVSDFTGVLHFLETDFSDFFKKDHLSWEYIEGNTRIVIKDHKYNFVFPHEVKKDFEEEYDEIYDKYRRRCKRLINELAGGEWGVCLIRTIQNPKELEYCIRNKKYINDIIKQGSKKNDIVFLIPDYMKPPADFPFPYYGLSIHCYPCFRLGLKSIFDTNKEFISWCIDNIEEEKRIKNQIFSLQHEVRRQEESKLPTAVIERKALQCVDNAYERIHQLERKLEISESRYKRLLKIEEADFCAMALPSQVIIYGAGAIGKLFYKKIKEVCSVAFFVDSRPIAKSWDSLPIIQTEELNYKMVENKTIIVIPTYDIREIMECIQKQCGQKAEIIPVETLLENRYKVKST